MKYLRQFMIILLFSFLGELLKYVLPFPVPARCLCGDFRPFRRTCCLRAQGWVLLRGPLLPPAQE